MLSNELSRGVFAVFIFLLLFTFSVSAQTNEFTFQGNLNDGALPANTNYDFEFRLFTAGTGGSLLGTLQRLAVPVLNGTFSVKLDFGPQFPGSDRFLEIAVKPSAGGSLTTLTPRQQISNTPYAVRSLNAASSDNSLQLGGVAANQYVVTSDPRLSDARPPAAGSPNYIQNGLTAQSANFNITGTASVGGTLSGNIVDTATQYNINGNRILGNPGSENTFVGVGAGVTNPAGIENSFFGRLAGTNNSTGSGNSFFGFIAGRFTIGGSNNSIFGNRAGVNNSSGSFNSFFGHRAGENSSGSSNSFFGTGAGLFNGSGNSNTLIGHDAGNTNSFGSFNTILGDSADVSTGNLTNATAIGTNALVSQSNSLVLGSINGTNGATADTNVGIGTTAPASRFHVSGTGIIRARINSDSNAGIGLALNEQSLWSVATVSPGHFQIFNDRLGQNAVSISTFDNSLNLGALNVSGIVTLASLGNAGATALCRNTSNQISLCSSSIRYKSNVNEFRTGLSLIDRLRPVSFTWKDGGMRDLGLVAEEVERVDPLLVTYAGGQVEGVKYDRIGVVLINAVKEQQSEIDAQKKEIEDLRSQIDALKKIVCAASTSCEPHRQ